MKIYVVPEDDSIKAKVEAYIHNRNVDLKCAMDEHPMETLAFGTAAITTFGVALKAILRNVNLRKEERSKNLRVWDPVLGIYWGLRKEMSQNQQLEFESRRKAGETCGAILQSMKLLK
jgi:hypothetical protein